ncbi:MAG: 16S rRNA (cytidine(1402)-2'-O)-methyltransferase [Ignavibacteriales bacterium]|nr:16S rRNA (cytidine(1402)-2'-O)-methyltransferase [Ignavibacteriales bacterium]
MAGTLFLVATPIGNWEDITLRALRVLKEVDLVVFEERREGSRLLRHYGIDKPVESLNEHNEAAATQTILNRMKSGGSVAIISDAGTPVFSDPGQTLVQRAIQLGIRVVPIPGASSLMPALIVSGFPIREFLFQGFLSPKRERRVAELQKMKRETRTVVLMEAPYRLVQLVRDIAEVFGESRRICVAFDLTLPTEEIFHGSAPELYKRFLKEERKGEFVLLLEGQSPGATRM